LKAKAARDRDREPGEVEGTRTLRNCCSTRSISANGRRGTGTEYPPAESDSRRVPGHASRLPHPRWMPQSARAQCNRSSPACRAVAVEHRSGRASCVLGRRRWPGRTRSRRAAALTGARPLASRGVRRKLMIADRSPSESRQPPAGFGRCAELCWPVAASVFASLDGGAVVPVRHVRRIHRDTGLADTGKRLF
jgi:hypothetical protein